MQAIKKKFTFIAVWMAIVGLLNQHLLACTGITLRAKDGAVVFARTQEWGTFDLRSRVVIVPRNYALQDMMPDGKPGLKWTTRYGTVGIDCVEKNYLIDGMNEKGLSVNLFYHEGFAEYEEYDPTKADDSVSVLSLAPYLLTTCASVAEVRESLEKIHVVGVFLKEVGGTPPLHIMVTDQKGNQIVIEFTKGVTTIHEAPLGVVTNNPNYDWHIDNLKNYVNLDVPLPKRNVHDLRSLRFGAGGRLYGLPGDLASPSRFIRAAAYASTARETANGEETMYEAFRILDNFNLTVGTAAEGGGELNQEGMRSSTAWTTVYDTKNLVLYYHTQHNRRVRRVDFEKLNFDAKEVVRIPLDRVRAQDIEDVLPSE